MLTSKQVTTKMNPSSGNESAGEARLVGWGVLEKGRHHVGPGNPSKEGKGENVQNDHLGTGRCKG